MLTVMLVGQAIPYGSCLDMPLQETYARVGRPIRYDSPSPSPSIRQWWKRIVRTHPSRDQALFSIVQTVRARGSFPGGPSWCAGTPPGTSKWNKIEHRLFCHITENWRGKPLTTFETIVDLIGHTRTAAGLRVKAKLDTRTYPTGVPVSRAQMDTIALLPDTFHGEWNYELLPR